MPPSPTVLLLHGLGRSARSMRPLARRLRHAGFRARPVDYPSTCHPIATLVEEHVRPAADAAAEAPLHFVTHSLGGILVRAYAARYGLPDGTRVVMVAPPNAGNEFADLLHERWPFRHLCGPALAELRTGPEGLAEQLGRVDFELGVIAGTRNVYPGLSRVLGAPNDGRVSVASTKVEGMADFAIVRAGHAFISRHAEVARLSVAFLRTGRFPDETWG